MSFAPQGISPFLPGNNYMKINHGVKKEVDRSLILRKKNNKVNYKKCSDEELLELLKKNEKLLENKALVDNLPDKGEKIKLKNEEIKAEINNRNIIIDKKEEKEKVKEEHNKEVDTENEDKSTDTTETEVKKDKHAMDIESINQKLQTINISDENEKTSTDNKLNRVKRGQAKVAERILKDSTANKTTFMIPHKLNQSHSKLISIEESLEIQIRQRKLQKEREIREAIKRLERTKMSTGPVNYYSNEYRNTHSDFDDDDDDSDADSDDNIDNSSYYDSSDAEADEYLFGNHQ